jgi:hypothetical protein
LIDAPNGAPDFRRGKIFRTDSQIPFSVKSQIRSFLVLQVRWLCYVDPAIWIGAGRNHGRG